jgi:type II secretory pathway predicted ATPase ExeA
LKGNLAAAVKIRNQFPMCEAFDGFTEKPFSLLPDPGFLFMGRQHSVAYAMLQYGLTNQAGFTVITGGIGYGKTTLVRHLLD